MSTQHNIKKTKHSQPSNNESRWLTRFLEAKVFLKLPAKNLQTLISQLREINVTAGNPVIAAGDSASYYYIVKQGELSLSYQQQPVSTLQAGDGFGEELLSENGQYIFDVCALTDASVMQLPRDSFTQLLVSPTITTAKQQANTNNGIWLNTNTLDQHSTEISQHMPYPKLRALLSQLDKQAHYLINHHDFGLCKASAFTLAQLGYTVTVIEALSIDIESVSDINVNEANLDPDIAAELADIENQLKSLETLITPTEPVKTKPPRNASIQCVERDDEQLWTPIPATGHRNTESLALLNNKDKKITAQKEPESQGTKKPETSNWLSDDFVWEKVLGFDSTKEVDVLIEEESAKSDSYTLQDEAPSTATHATQSQPTHAALYKPHINQQPKPNTKIKTTSNNYAQPRAKHSKAPLIVITTTLAIAIISLPFAFPNKWNAYYNQASSYIEKSEIKQMIAGLGELKLELSTENKEALAKTSKQTPTINIDQQIQLSFEHVKSQAKAEFTRKLAAAKPVVPTPTSVPTSTPTLQLNIETTIATEGDTENLPAVTPLTEISLPTEIPTEITVNTTETPESTISRVESLP